MEQVGGEVTPASLKRTGLLGWRRKASSAYSTPGAGHIRGLLFRTGATQTESDHGLEVMTGTHVVGGTPRARRMTWEEWRADEQEEKARRWPRG